MRLPFFGFQDVLSLKIAGNVLMNYAARAPNVRISRGNQMDSRIRTGLIALLTGCLSGCSSTFTGVLAGSGEQVSFSRYAGLCLDSIMVTLPDGETFIGYLPDTAESDARCKVGAYRGSRKTYSMLYGDRISTMYCDFQAAQPDTADVLGSTGLCKLSDSRTISLKDKPGD
jgi:hypothetical protein